MAVIASLLLSVDAFTTGAFPRSLHLMRFVAGLCWAEFIRADSRERGQNHPRVFYFISIVVPLFAVPYHLYQTRGCRKTLGVMAAATVWLIILIVAGLATGTIRYPR